MGFAFRFQGSRATRGDPPLSLALSVTNTTISVNVGAIPPDQAQTVDTNAGQADSTATASGGDGSYTFAWTITETEDNNVGAAGCAVLATGTQNAARYNTATFRVTQPALISGGAPIEPPPRFQEATYRLRCTVTDGNSDTATADYTVLIAGA